MASLSRGERDAFNRLRVSNPVHIGHIATQYNANRLRMEAIASGTGVVPEFQPLTRFVKLAVGAGVGESVYQSYNYFPYQPGFSLLVRLTGLLGPPVAGAIVETGFFDQYNGYFLRQNSTNGLQVVHRTSTSGAVVEDAVNQADWNVSNLDGSVPGEHKLDITKVHLIIIDMAYLGVGNVRIGFEIEGNIYYVHQFKAANVIDRPHVQSAALPVQMIVRGTPVASKEAFFKCSEVISEGGETLSDAQGELVSSPEGVVVAADNVRTHLISIRPKVTYNNLPNHIMFMLRSLNLAVTGLNPVFWELVMGQVISGGTWVDVNTIHSGFEYNAGGTASGDPALVIYSGYVVASATQKGALETEISQYYPVTLNRAGQVRADGTLSIIVRGISGPSATRGTLHWKEIR